MKKLVFVFILLICSCASLKEKPLVGEYSWQTWLNETKWDAPPSSFYKFDSLDLLKLKKLSTDKNIAYVIFVHSLCDDCRETLPKIIALFENAGIAPKSYRIFGLDDYLREPSGYFAKFNIKTTPQLFVLSGDKTLGSVNFPNKNLAEEIIRILNAEF